MSYLLVWPDEMLHVPASTVTNIRGVLKIARAETGAITSMLGVTANDLQTGSSGDAANSRSIKRRFLESNAAAIAECLEGQNLLAYGCVRVGWRCERYAFVPRSPFGIVLVPVLHATVPCGCMLLIFAGSRAATSLHPALESRLRYLAQAISAILRPTECGGASLLVTGKQSTRPSPPISGRLSELKTVLHGSTTCWEDIGEQLCSYLQGAFAREETDCDSHGE